MVRIKYVNPACTCPDNKFDWDETDYLEPDGGMADENDPDAVRVVLTCSCCGTGNVVWVKRLKKDVIVGFVRSA